MPVINVNDANPLAQTMFSNNLSEGTGRLKARMRGVGARLQQFGESARSIASPPVAGPKAWLESGPLLNKALARADQAAILFGDYRPLANLAGKRSLYSRMMDSPTHQGGMRWVSMMAGGHTAYAGSGFGRSGFVPGLDQKALEEKGIFRLTKGAKIWRLFGRALGLGFIGYEMYEGYKKGGAWGAVKGGAEFLAESYLIGAAINSPLFPTAAAIGAGYGMLSVLGSYARNPSAFGLRSMMRDRTSAYRREHAGVQLGTPSIDPFGNNATMRQRSLNAIQNSRLNGRTALGNEASLSYSPYYR